MSQKRGPSTVAVLVGIAALLFLTLVTSVGVIGWLAVSGRIAIVTPGDRRPDPVPAVAIPKVDKREASQPLDPWSVEPVPVTAWIAILPLDKDGVYTKETRRIARLMASAWSASLERPIGVLSHDTIRGYLERQSTFTPRGDSRVLFDAAERVRVYHKATHILHGTLQEQDGQWVAEAMLRLPTGEISQRFSVNEGEDCRLASEMMRWMVENAGIAMSAETAHNLTLPPLGESRWSSLEGDGKAMMEDAGHAGWDGASAANPTARFLRAGVAAQAHDVQTLAAMKPDPLAADAPALDHMLRLLWADAAGEKGVQAHEAALLLAKYPGLAAGAETWKSGIFGRGERRDDYIGALEKWSERTGGSSYSRQLLAGAHIDSAWDWRGAGWGSTVNSRARQGFNGNLQKSRAIAEDLLRVEVADPRVGLNLLTIIGATSDSAELIRTHYALAERFPDFRDFWDTTLHFNRPRWGGSNEESTKLIDKAMKSRPENASFGRLALEYWWGESKVSVPDSVNFPFKLRRLMDTYEGVGRQVDEGMERLLSDGCTAQDAAFVITAAFPLQDHGYARRAVERHPDAYTYIDNNLIDSGVRGTALSLAVWSMAELGEWDQTLEAIEMVKKNDEDVRAGRTHQGYAEWNIAFPDERLREILHGYVLVSSGKDRTRGYELLEANARGEALEFYTVYTKYRDKQPATIADFQQLELCKEAQPTNPEAWYMEALLHESQGASEKAAAAFAEAKKRTGAWPPFHPMRMDCVRVFGGPTDVELRAAKQAAKAEVVP